ncbi:MAG: alpha-amylase, partial [Bacteroidetes bacterium]|nr:alpha-amylase [Bacteroidota bacterium]
LWLPPAYKSTVGGISNGYDVYDIYDLGQFDQKGSVRTKWGTKRQYKEAVKALHQAGIQVYVDIVLNHMGGADETERICVRKVNPDNRNEFISDVYEIEAHTKFTFPGRGGKYSKFIWDHRCFTGVDYAEDTKETGIFSIQNEYGEGWEDVIDDEKGNYDYLMYCDIEFRNPAVREELKRWGCWYLKEIGFDGVRLDAVKHMSPQFFNEWLDDMRGIKQDLFAVGEYWAPGELHQLVKYIEATSGRMTLFDAPLHKNFHEASKAGKEYDLSKIFENTLVAVNPALAVTVVDNHDTQPLQSLEAPVEKWFKPLAYSLILLREAGYPCIFYPDMYGAHYVDKGPDGNDHEIFLDVCPHLDQLLCARKTFAYGQQRDYFDHANCVGWTREGTDEMGESGCAVLLSNGDEGFKNMEMGKRHAGKVFVDFLKNHPAEVTINEDGWGEF